VIIITTVIIFSLKYYEKTEDKYSFKDSVRGDKATVEKECPSESKTCF
jgi:hypothetical protein